MPIRLFARFTRSAPPACLALAVLLSVAGCGERHSSDVHRLRWVTDPNPARVKQLELFHADHPDSEVFVDWASGGLTKILVQMAAHAGPDLIDCYTEAQMRQYARYRALLPITDLCREHGITLDQFWPQIRPWMVYNDEIYGLPTNAGTFVLFYNKDHFDQAGLAYPDKSWTWETFLDAAKRLTVRTGPEKRFGCYIGYHDHWLWQAGAEFWNEDRTRCTLDSPAALRAFQFLYDLRHTHNVAPSPADEEAFSAGEWGSGAINLFAAGRVSMLDMGRWGVIQFREYQQRQRESGKPVLRFGVAHLPYDATRATTFLARSTTINAACPDREAAFRFVKYLTTPAYNRLIAEGGDGFPAVKALAQSDLFLTDPRYPEEDQNQVYLESVEYARPPVMSPYIIPAEFDNLYNDALDYIRSGERKPDEVCAELARKTNDAIARYRQREGS